MPLDKFLEFLCEAAHVMMLLLPGNVSRDLIDI